MAPNPTHPVTRTRAEGYEPIRDAFARNFTD